MSHSSLLCTCIYDAQEELNSESGTLRPIPVAKLLGGFLLFDFCGQRACDVGGLTNDGRTQQPLRRSRPLLKLNGQVRVKLTIHVILGISAAQLLPLVTRTCEESSADKPVTLVNDNIKMVTLNAKLSKRYCKNKLAQLIAIFYILTRGETLTQRSNSKAIISYAPKSIA